MRRNVLVLNHDYQAIALCSVERAFLLVYLKKAELVSPSPGAVLRSVREQFPCPSVIRLYRYVHVPYRKVTLSRLNIFKRDAYQCVYCDGRQDLTVDHVFPRSMGGRDTWENLVTACQSCNTRKGNRTPEQCGMTMRRKPFRPSYVMYLTNFAPSIQEAWRPYLMI